MKPFQKQVIASAFMGIIVPGMILGVAVGASRKRPSQTVTSIETTQAVMTQSQYSAQTQRLYIPVEMKDGQVRQMDLEDYLVGVVLAEMPASFELEAHKAQAVVARTYALKRFKTGTKHDSGGVCTNSACCQAYRSPEDYLSDGGSEEDLNKIRSAVTATAGQVLLYDQELIEATYFSCSGGMTEDSLAVWGLDVPYLKATESPGEESAAYYTDTVYFTASEFRGKLGQNFPGAPTEWLGEQTRTDGGGVESMVIGGITYKGTTLRQLLGLRSTAFSMFADSGGITVQTRGFGHRVGMSQYGADAMAVSGSTYQQILAHYYAGTELAVYEPQNN